MINENTYTATVFQLGNNANELHLSKNNILSHDGIIYPDNEIICMLYKHSQITSIEVQDDGMLVFDFSLTSQMYNNLAK